MVIRDVETFIQKVLPLYRKVKIFYNKHERYARIPAGFDIETTRIETRGYMYAWTVTIGDFTCYCRLWKEFDRLMEALNVLCMRINAVCIVWVANLGFEFSFIGRRFHWEKFFATDAHEVLIARTGRVEFRECLTISGKGGLANLAKNYTKTQKMVGDLDYDIIRISSEEYCTPINQTEDTYIINDTKILSEWAEYIFTTYADNKKNIPLTATSLVDTEIKESVKATGQEETIKKAVQSLFPQTKETYNFIMRFLFRGGYTHASAWYLFVIYPNVIGADFTSSYPAVMVHYSRYPVTPFVQTTLETNGKEITDKRIDSMCVWFVAIFHGIDRKTIHSIESEHKIIAYENAKFDNGRLYHADRIKVALSDVDYEIYQMFYTWDKIEIIDAYTAYRGKLPEYLLKPLRNAYKKKCRLKKEGKDDTIEYNNAKAFVNSFYGYCVKRLNFEKWFFNEETGLFYSEPCKKEYETMIKNQVLSPYFGIYVTALARLCLLKNVYAMDSDFYDDNAIYCDTDSIYMLNTPENIAIIKKWNADIFEMNKELDPEFYDIGAFDWIGSKDDQPKVYRFKTLGAKRYIKYADGVCEVTAAGLPKRALERKLARPFRYSDHCYIAYENPKKKTGRIGYVDINEIFDSFDDTMYLSEFESEKKRAAYNPDEHGEYITDVFGNTVYMSEKSSCAILPVKFTIKGLQNFLEELEELYNERRKPIC